MTPDWHPIIGNDPGRGLVLCTAKGSAATDSSSDRRSARCVAETILDGQASTVDISPLRLERFAEGALLAGSYAGNQA